MAYYACSCKAIIAMVRDCSCDASCYVLLRPMLLALWLVLALMCWLCCVTSYSLMQRPHVAHGATSFMQHRG